MNWADVISNAIRIFLKRENYAYFYGAKGQILTPELMVELIACEPAYWAKYSPAEIEKIKAWSIYKVGVDCSGFVNLCVKQTNWSTGYWNDCVNKTTPVLGTWGNLLYTTHGGKGRHVAIDVGAGRFLHAPKEMHSIELGVIKNYDWEGSGQIKGIDYTLASNR